MHRTAPAHNAFFIDSTCSRRTRVRPPVLLAAIAAALLPAVGAAAAPLSVASTGPLARSQGTGWPQPEVRHSRNGVLDTKLTVGRTLRLIGGRLVEAWTYDGMVPGPTLRVRPGDRLRIRLVNDLGRPSRHAEVPCGRREPPHVEGPEEELLTNLHTHGLEVSPEGNADNPFIVVRPGEVCQYDIRIPEDHRGGFFWYHPHGHPSSLKQMWGGLAGAIIVEGGLDEIAEVRQAKDRVLVLQELFLNGRNRVPRGEPLAAGGDPPFTTLPAEPVDIIEGLLNGAYRPALTIRPGETQRWRIVNASAHRFYLLTLEAHVLHQVAQDGLTLSETMPAERILLSPGNRFEVIVKGGRPGIYALKALPYDQGHPGGPLPERHLATVISAGPPADGALPGALIPQRDLRGKSVARSRTIDWDGNVLRAPVQFFINHRQFDPQRIDETIPVGGVEEWTLRNNDVFQHNFHIHVNPFQVVAVNGTPFPAPVAAPSWWDTFPLPPRLVVDGREVPGTVTIRLAPRPDLPGRTVFHCHILPHQDRGMMTAISFDPPGMPVTTASSPSPPPAAVGPQSPLPPSSGLPVGPLVEPPPPAPVLAPELPPRFVLTQAICLPRGSREPHRQGPPTPPVSQLPRCDPQTVPVGARVQIQVPGTPARWTLGKHSPGVVPLGERRLPSPGRVRGTLELYVFDFLVLAPGEARVALHESPAWVVSSGTFEYPLRVVELPNLPVPPLLQTGREAEGLVLVDQPPPRHSRLIEPPALGVSTKGMAISDPPPPKGSTRGQEPGCRSPLSDVSAGEAGRLRGVRGCSETKNRIGKFLSWKATRMDVRKFQRKSSTRRLRPGIWGKRPDGC